MIFCLKDHLNYLKVNIVPICDIQIAIEKLIQYLILNLPVRVSILDRLPSGVRGFNPEDTDGI